MSSKLIQKIKDGGLCRGYQIGSLFFLLEIE